MNLEGNGSGRVGEGMVSIGKALIGSEIGMPLGGD